MDRTQFAAIAAGVAALPVLAIAAPDPAPQMNLRAPRYVSDVSQSRRFRVHWQGSTGVRYRLEVRRDTNVSTRWVTLVRSTRRRSATFRGRAGVSYLFRLRARDGSGHLSRYDYAETTVPRDDRSPRLRFSRGWRRIHSGGAYGRTLTRARRAGQTASISFRGTRAALIVRRSTHGGRPPL